LVLFPQAMVMMVMIHGGSYLRPDRGALAGDHRLALAAAGRCC